MAILYSVGTALVTKEELADKLGETRKFAERKADVIKFSTGKIDKFENPSSGKTEFVPVGMNQPLTIELRNVYTGSHPKVGFLGKQKDMLLTSALKGFVTYEAAPKAVNFLSERVGSYSKVGPAALAAGTPLVYYSPAVTEPATLISFEAIFDNFPKETINKFANAFQAAAGIPIFASASFYLIAAGMVTKLFGSAGESIFDGQVAFRMDDTITFERPGASITRADYRLLFPNDFDEKILQKYYLNTDGILVDSSQQEYKGEHPYITISLDGRKNDAYKNFVPYAITASLLERFYNIKDGKEQSIDTLYEALSLYSDFKFRSQAEKVKDQLQKIKKDDPMYSGLLAKYKAFRDNIHQEVIKPADISI